MSPARSTGASGARNKSGGIKFAAYLRVSTDQTQSPAESRRWQLARCEPLIVGHGTIVAEFFDQGQSRSIPWKRRPQATALLEEAARKDRRFDAVVIAEPARAFAGTEVSNVFPVLTHYGVSLWCPEFGPSPIDPDSEAADMLLLMFGSMSKAERNRIKVRTKAAKHAQAAQGRRQGGSPPFGYLLVDTDVPHPNPAKAREDRMLRGLAVDPVAAPVVRRIFAEYVDGKGLRVLADELTAEGILSPSGHDPARYPHRQHSKGAWSRGALLSILKNPTYLGRAPYGMSRRVEVLVDPTDPSQGYRRVLRRNPPSEWIFPEQPTHEAIIDPQTFQVAQERLSARQGGRGPQELAAGRNPYALRGLITCAECGKRLEAVQFKGTRYYRCRLTTLEYSRLGPAGEALELTHPRSAYLREDVILPAVNGWLAQVFDPANAEQTAKLLAADAAEEADEARREARADHWQRVLIEAEAKLETYRALAETGQSPMEVIGRWLTEADAERVQAETELARLEPAAAPTVDEVKKLLAQMRRVASRLNKADPKVLNEAFRALGLRVTYAPRAVKARVEVIQGGLQMSR